jgi:hypothetical protein
MEVYIIQVTLVSIMRALWWNMMLLVAYEIFLTYKDFMR